MRYVKPNDDSGNWDVFNHDEMISKTFGDDDVWLAEFESESLADEFAIAPVVREEFMRLLHWVETPGDFSKTEEADLLYEAAVLASKIME